MSLPKDKAAADFAGRAVIDMDQNPSHYTYAETDPEPGELLAIRWNAFTILVVRLDETFEPALYSTHDLIQKDLPPLRIEPQQPRIAQ